MARAALDVLPRPPVVALVIVPQGTSDGPFPPGVRVLHAAHPLPDATSVHAGRETAALLASAVAGDVVLVLLSGGASALCVAPAGAISIDDYAELVRTLLHAGADIRELNAVRSRIDRLKGGGMAQLLAPARAVALIVSDVVGNPLDIIASGPLTSPTAEPASALHVLERYRLTRTVPSAVIDVLNAPLEPAAHAAVEISVIADNEGALEGAAAAAARLGYEVRLHDEPVTGPAREAGSRLARRAIGAAYGLSADDPPVCMISGGEPTVAVTGSGSGGRNQELVLAAALELQGVPGITIASIGTDGVDGPTDAAGGMIDGASVTRAATGGVDAALALRNNDSHAFLRAAGGLIRTGPTGTNVMDVQIALVSGQL